MLLNRARTSRSFNGTSMNSVTRALRKLQQALQRINFRSRRVRTAAICASSVFLLLVLVFSLSDPMAPIINDVTTDLEDPVLFTQNTKLNPYPEAFKEQVKTGYPDLKSLTVAISQDAAFSACLAAAGKMTRWNINHEDRAGGNIEGVAVTALLRFKDDLVIRLRGDGNQTVIDMRSRSRVGKGDLGANAARIMEYFEKVKEEVQ